MKTKKETIAALISKLLEAHMLACDDKYPADKIAHVDSERWETNANIEALVTMGDRIRLKLSDDAVFVIQVC